MRGISAEPKEELTVSSDGRQNEALATLPAASLGMRTVIPPVTVPASVNHGYGPTSFSQVAPPVMGSISYGYGPYANLRTGVTPLFGRGHSVARNS